jgi:hypothetical protein
MVTTTNRIDDNVNNIIAMIDVSGVDRGWFKHDPMIHPFGFWGLRRRGVLFCLSIYRGSENCSFSFFLDNVINHECLAV